MTKRTIIKEIKELDDALDLLRHNIAVCSEKSKPGYMKVINMVLDERLIIMSVCDKNKPDSKKKTPQVSIV